jgi:arylsulfatase A-like enzyme
VSNALVHTDASLAEIIQALKDNQLFDSTLIVLTAKHGQSPSDPTTLTILSPTVVTSVIDPIAQVVQATEDDAALIWLADQSKTTAAAAALLASQPTASLQDVMSGERLKLAFGDPAVDPRVPDIIAIGKPGTIYTTSSSKAAEHGGFSAQDINVPIVISHPSLAAQTIKAPVTIMQIAPTILQVLGLNPYALQAVQAERTSVLPGFEAAQLALLSISPSLGVSGASTVHLVNGQAQFQVGIAQEQHFAVQASTDLSHWTSFATNTLSINATMSVTDPDAGSFTNRFYRAMAVP